MNFDIDDCIKIAEYEYHIKSDLVKVLRSFKTSFDSLSGQFANLVTADTANKSTTFLNFSF